MDLNNINISDLKEKLLQFADKKTLIKFGIGFGSIILFLIIYYAILNPIVKTKKVMLDDMTLKQTEISTFNNEIIAYKARLKKIEPEFKKNSTLFHSKEEVDPTAAYMIASISEAFHAWQDTDVGCDTLLFNVKGNKID